MNHVSAIQFPCEFPIKIVGKGDSVADFEAAVLGIIRKHVPDLGEAALQEKYSKENKFLSLTVTINATSQAQLDAIYEELTANPHVLMAL